MNPLAALVLLLVVWLVSVALIVRVWQATRPWHRAGWIVSGVTGAAIAIAVLAVILGWRLLLVPALAGDESASSTLVAFALDITVAIAGAFVGAVIALGGAYFIYSKTREDEKATYQQEREDRLATDEAARQQEQRRDREKDRSQLRAVRQAMRYEIDGNLTMLGDYWNRITSEANAKAEDELAGELVEGDVTTEKGQKALAMARRAVEEGRIAAIGSALHSHPVPVWNETMWKSGSPQVTQALHPEEFQRSVAVYQTLAAITATQQRLTTADYADLAKYLGDPVWESPTGMGHKFKSSDEFNAARKLLIPPLETEVKAVLESGNPINPEREPPE